MELTSCLFVSCLLLLLFHQSKTLCCLLFVQFLCILNLPTIMWYGVISSIRGQKGISHLVFEPCNVLLLGVFPRNKKKNLTRTIYLCSTFNGALPIVVVACSIVLIVKTIIQRQQLSLAYRPLLASYNTTNYQYGTTIGTNGPASSSSSMPVLRDLQEEKVEEEEPLPRWTLFSVMRLLVPALQCIILFGTLIRIMNSTYDLDPIVEGNSNKFALASFSIKSVYWVNNFSLLELSFHLVKH